MVVVNKASKLVFEAEDNYQKQTFRNRTYIADSNGKLLLNVPIKHSKDGARQKYKEVVVENAFPWQSQHWKSIQTAYRTSPYFEFYEDDLAPLFKEPVQGLMEHNLNIFSTLIALLGIEIEIESSVEYFREPKQKDYRYLAAKKQPTYSFTPYHQVLEGLHGFLENLSVLDLLVNEGPNAQMYLENQTLKL